MMRVPGLVFRRTGTTIIGTATLVPLVEVPELVVPAQPIGGGGG